jgi:dipeptidyl aminopeptidase B
MSCKVAEANAGVHSLAMAVAVCTTVDYLDSSLITACSACDKLASIRYVVSGSLTLELTPKLSALDSIYTERYMDLPQVNPEGYVTASISNATGFHHVDFLLAHGSADDNVHYANSAHLLDMLTKEQVRGFRFRMFTDRYVILLYYVLRSIE